MHFSKYEKILFFAFNAKLLPIAFVEYTIRKNGKYLTKWKSQIFWQIFCQYFANILSMFQTLNCRKYISYKNFTLNLVGCCKTWISAYLPIFRFFRCFGLRGATSSSFQGVNFHELSFDNVTVLIQTWCNSFANGHRQSFLRNISRNENYSLLINMQTEQSAQNKHL